MSEEKQITRFKGIYDFLSNFFPCQFEFDGDICRSSEHAYQAAKMLYPEDKTSMISSGTPGWCKRMGKALEKKDNWDNIKKDVMLRVLRAKFSVTSLKGMLLATGDLELIEGNDHGDVYWGCVPTGFSLEPRYGENNLGKLLMQVREELRAQS